MSIKFLFLLLRNVRIKSFDKGEILIKEGSTERNVYFIRRGLVRSYMIDEKDNEVTFQIFDENKLFANTHSVLFNEPSRFNYQTLEPTKVYTADYNAFLELTSKNLELVELNRMYFGKRVFKKTFQRVESFIFLSPEERYQKYIKDNPNIINRAPDKYIANVLGITPVSLSRIRKRIASRKN